MTQSVFVKSINIAVITALVPFIDKYPILKKLLNKSENPSSDWDFYMTVAGVGSYFLTNKVSEIKHKELLIELAELDKQGVEALNNFTVFIENNKNEGIDLKASIGFWVLWNIKGSQPTQDESRELAPAIGAYLQKIISDLAR